MKKILSLFICVFLSFIVLVSCGSEPSGNEIPDVFGIDYTDAIEILESDGYTVSAIEVEVDSFSDKLLYPLEKVNKGTVFKIDDYIIDNIGNLNKNYDVFYKGGLVSSDKSVVIYYAKDDYVLNDDKDDEDPTTPEESVDLPATELIVETKRDDPVDESPQTIAPETQDNNTLRPDFKAAIDSYENYINDYVDFMKKYNANPMDYKLIAEYSKMMIEYGKMVKDFEKWEDEEMNAAETAYYVDVQSRVSKRLLEVAQ